VSTQFLQELSERSLNVWSSGTASARVGLTRHARAWHAGQEVWELGQCVTCAAQNVNLDSNALALGQLTAAAAQPVAVAAMVCTGCH
jgi:hypothetical protein